MALHVTALTSLVEELKRQLGRNSGTSSKPRSTDWKKARPAFRRKPAKVGGKPGHKGETLKMVADPAHIESHPINTRIVNAAARDRALF